MGKQTPSVVYRLGDNLYLNVTNRCTNRCYFCFRNYKEGLNGFNLKLSEEPSTEQISTAVKSVINKKAWKEIVFCGFGEALVRLDTVLEVSRQLKNFYPNIRVRVDTNGQAQLIHKNRNVPRELKQAGVDRVCVSLNAHNETIYNEVCKPVSENAFSEVLDFIKKTREENIETEISVVTIPEVDISRVQKIVEDLGVKLRIRQYEPCFW